MEGDRGAPLEQAEAEWIKENLELLVKHMDENSRQYVSQFGATYMANETEHLSMLPGNGACVLLQQEIDGFRRCLLETLHQSGEIGFQKPISCHLFPLIYKQTRFHKILNFEKRAICASGWGQGPSILKSMESALLRQFGSEFVQELFAKLAEMQSSAENADQ